jgi:putative membrane protein
VKADLCQDLAFLGCVIVAGIYGAFSVSRRIFFIQALPGIIALALVLLAVR